MVTSTFDDLKRVVIPQGKPGQEVAITENADGTITLSFVPAQPRKVSILEGLKPFTEQECEECWGAGNEKDEFDRLANHHSKLPPGPPPEF